MIVSNIKHLKVHAASYYKGLPVNATASTPVYEEILSKMYRELACISARYTRVVVVRLDLHPSIAVDPYDINFTDFRRSFTRRLATKYKSKVAYTWVREMGRSDHNDGVHWHLWVAIRHDDATQPYWQVKQIQRMIIESWAKVAGGNSRVHRSSWFYLKRNRFSREHRLLDQIDISDGAQGVLISCNALRTRVNNRNIVLGGVVDECFYALSYLAKIYTKVRTQRSKGDRIFASSHLNTNDKKRGRKIEMESRLKWIHDELRHKLDPISLQDEVFEEFVIDMGPPLLMDFDSPVEFFSFLKNMGSP